PRAGCCAAGPRVSEILEPRDLQPRVLGAGPGYGCHPRAGRPRRAARRQNLSMATAGEPRLHRGTRARALRPPASATLRDVAGVAGVSIATVSRILTGARPSAPATRTRVLAAAAQLDYRPSALAR